VSVEAPLAGRSALVTGASRGIGFATAVALARAGAWVGMVARSAGDLTAAAGKAGGHPLPADVSSAAGVDRLVNTMGEHLSGPPDLLVNSAGAFALSSLVDTDPEDFDRQIAANLRAPFLLIRALLPEMLARNSGHILNVGSIAGRLALPGNAAYSASKFGLRGLHEVLAVELAGTAIRLSLVEPAATDTPLWDPLDPDARDDLPSRAQMLRPEAVARAILFAVTQPAEVEVSHLAVRAV
jgi:NAD(P)-dependent dehydrogenase (short-subunit alcohol dehydrogenase family)